MYDKAIEILKTFEHHGYIAYIVGGYPRDYLLGIKTNDIDICTNATPKEIITIFKDNSLSNNDYGSVVINYKGSSFDVTTMRKDIKYENNRKPIKIKYISDLKTAKKSATNFMFRECFNATPNKKNPKFIN